jgi:hypothetical protein
MDNPQKLATMGTHDTGQRQTQQKHNNIIKMLTYDVHNWYLCLASAMCVANINITTY